MRYAVRSVGVAASAADMEMAMPFMDYGATVEQGATAATYQPARPVAVPADGGAHRATVAVVEMSAALDYITAPVKGAEAHLRATVTNTSEHTLPAGTGSTILIGLFG